MPYFLISHYSLFARPKLSLQFIFYGMYKSYTNSNNCKQILFLSVNYVKISISLKIFESTIEIPNLGQSEYLLGDKTKYSKQLSLLPTIRPKAM